MSTIFWGDVEDLERMQTSELLTLEHQDERKRMNNKVDQHMSWIDEEIPMEWVTLAFIKEKEGKTLLLYR
jgi:hypothetical protein